MRGEMEPADYRGCIEALGKLSDDELLVICRAVGASVPRKEDIDYSRNAWGQEIVRAISELRRGADAADRYREGLRLLGIG